MNMDLNGIIELVVRWAPTILFTLTLFVATLFGLIRGFRKSLILAIHATVIACLCIGAFFFLINSSKADEMILSITNNILGGPGALQELLNVSKDTSTLKEVLLEYIPTLLNAGDSYLIIIEENNEYLLTLVNVAYRLVFAIVLYIVYLVLVFFMFIIYFFFYPQRRYKRKKKKEGNYKKRALLGSAVGFTRGLVAGCIFLSFLGGALYTVSGGTGDEPMVEYSFEDESYNEIYGAYRSISSYGSSGIYKILNTFKDKNDQPYYLFAADLIFSGNLTSEELEINETVKFREEVGTYLGFAKDTINLLIKYGGPEIEQYISNPENADMDGIISIMQLEPFQEEFKALIEDFDSKTYFINLTFSLVTSIINHIDEMPFAESLDESVKELIKILFKKNHYSDYIPDEKEVKNSRKFKKNSNDAVTLPYINISHLITKDDVSTMFSIVCELLSLEKNDEGNINALDAVKQILPYMEQLSILNGSRKEEFEPVFTRLYCFVENKYLTAPGYEGVRYSDIVNENIGWTDELLSLIDVATNAIEMYQNVYVPESEIFDVILSIFDAQHECYEQNMELYDNISSSICSSKLLGKALSSSGINKMIEDGLKETIPNIYLLDNMKFTNTYDNEGNKIESGELDLLFSSLKILGLPENKKLVTSLFNQDESNPLDDSEMLKLLSTALNSKDEKGNDLSVYFSDSKLLRSVLSAFIVDFSKGEEAILYVPNDCLEIVDGAQVNLLKKDQYNQLLDYLPDVIEVASPLLGKEVSLDEIQGLLENEKVKQILNSHNKIIEGTISKMFIDVVGSVEFLTLPNHLNEVDSWLSDDSKTGELNKIIKILTESSIDISSLISEQVDISILSNLSESDFDLLFDSSVMYYSISNIIGGNLLEINDFTIVVPNSCKTTLENDSIDYLISKAELKAIIKEISSFDLSNTSDFSSIIVQFIKKIIETDDGSSSLLDNSKIFSASLINLLATNQDINNFVDIPTPLLNEVNVIGLENYDETYLWYDELPNLIYSLEEMLDISNKESFTFDENSLTSNFTTLVSSFDQPSNIAKKASENKTRLDVCYDSLIIKENITTKLEEALSCQENPLVDKATVDLAKDEEGYLRKQELYSFSNILDIFDISFDSNMQIDENFKDKVKDELFNLNELRSEEKYQGKTSLDIIYESIIVVSLFSNELDNAIEGLVSTNVLDYGNVKDENGRYTKQEVSALVDAINVIGIESMDDIATTDFSIKKIKDNIDIIYNSTLIAGVFAKQLKDTMNSTSILNDHPYAYISDNVDIYHKHEITSLLDILNDKDVDNISMNDISLDNIRKAIYDQNNLLVPTSSYILVATLSNNIFNSIDNGTDNIVVVPLNSIDVVNSNLTTIKPEKLAELLYSLKALGITSLDDENGINVTNYLYLPKQGSFDSENPEADRRETIIASDIMRATITKMIATIENNKTDKQSININLENIETENASFIKDHKGNEIVVICKEQLEAIFTALDVFVSDPDAQNKLEIASFNSLSDILLVKDNLDQLYAADPFKYRISNLLSSLSLDSSEQSTYNIVNQNIENVQTVSLQAIKTLVGV